METTLKHEQTKEGSEPNMAGKLELSDKKLKL